jgi:glycosyltransferase involved in cell wall biosynthesis
MRKVLVIAYHYPPIGGGGVFRTLKFTKYLPRFGFKPCVLSVKNSIYHVGDTSLLKEIPPEVKVIRTFSLEHKLFLIPFSALGTTPKWILMPDINVGWLPFAVRRGEQIIKKEGVDVIYATAPIYTSLLIGCLLKRKTGKPLVIDFRDPWTQNVFIKYPTRLHKKIEEKLEKFVLETADYIIANTESMRLKLIEKYPFIKGKCATITNGFDSEDFKGLVKSANREKFTIAHTGSIYGLMVDTGKYFLIALKELVEEKREIESKIQVLFVGHPNKQIVGLVKELSLQNVVKILGYTSHSESLKLMVDSAVLLLIMGAGELYDEKTGSLRIPGKLFEYLGAKRLILALAPRGDAADIIKSTKAGIIVPPNDVNSIKQTVFQLFQKWKRGDLESAQCDVSEYDRKLLTEKLAEIFQQVYSKYE